MHGHMDAKRKPVRKFAISYWEVAGTVNLAVFRKTRYYLYLERRFARICNLTPAQHVTYIGKVMNLEVGKAGVAVSQTRNLIARPYLYGLFRRRRRV
jgi:hypothetical protein